MPHSLCIHRCLLSIKNRVLLAAGIVTLLSVQEPGRFLAADDLRYSSAGDGTTRLFQFPPETAEDAVEAARIAIGLDRPADARGFLRQLIERDVQAPEMLALRRRFGLAMLIDLRRDARLQPEAGQLLKQMQSALPQLSAADLNDRIELLGSGLAAAEDAQFDLMVAGPATLPLLLARTPSTRSGRAAANLLETLAFDWRHDLTNLLPSATYQSACGSTSCSQVLQLTICMKSCCGSNSRRPNLPKSPPPGLLSGDWPAELKFPRPQMRPQTIS